MRSARASLFPCSCLGVGVIRRRVFTIELLVVAVVFARRLIV